MGATCSEIRLTFKVPGIYLGSAEEGKELFVAGRLTWPISCSLFSRECPPPSALTAPRRNQRAPNYVRRSHSLFFWIYDLNRYFKDFAVSISFTHTPSPSELGLRVRRRRYSLTCLRWDRADWAAQRLIRRRTSC